MKLFKETKIIYAFAAALFLWALLPATTRTAVNTSWLEIMGYAPIASFSKHPSPPKIGRRTFKKLVWRHERYAILWLPLWGRKMGEYGLYKTEHVRRFGIGRGRWHKIFIPLTLDEAQKYAAMVNVKLYDKPPISYWSLFFGWLVFVPFAFIYYWDRRFYGNLRKKFF